VTLSLAPLTANRRFFKGFCGKDKIGRSRISAAKLISRNTPVSAVWIEVMPHSL
jgi:hypothetical protein